MRKKNCIYIVAVVSALFLSTAGKMDELLELEVIF